MELTLGTWQIAENATGGTAPLAVQTLASPDLGAAGVPDVAQLELYANDPGTFDLSLFPDDNESTCLQCVRLFQDLRSDGGLARQFFQSGGSFAITAADSSAGLLQGSLTDVTLVEVAVDPTTSVSAPVPGGTCLHIASSSVDVAPASTSGSSESSASSSSGSGSSSGSSDSGSSSGSGSTSSGSDSGSGTSGSSGSDSGSGSSSSDSSSSSSGSDSGSSGSTG